MRALPIVLVVACTALAHAQFYPKKFLPSLPAAKVERTKVAPPKTVPDLKSTLYKMADVLGMLRGGEEEDSILTMHYWGTGTMTSGGQTYKIESYRGNVRFDVPGLRTDMTLVGADGKKRRQVEVVSGQFAWNEAEPGVNPTPAPGTLQDRLLEIWTLPHGLVKAAVKAGNMTKVTLENGVVYVTFPLPAPLTGTARAALNSTDVMILTMDNGDKYELTNLVDRVETRIGDVVTETSFSNYEDWNEADYKSDVLFPGRIVRRRGATTLLDLTVTRTNTYNPYVIMPVPENIRKAGPQAPSGK
jgi:hypothetical protein